MIKFSKTSTDRMVGLHPDLLRVINKAAELADKSEDFLIVEGLRSKEQMMINYGKGRTKAQCELKGVPGKYANPAIARVTWLNDPLKSNHGVQSDGYGHAVDVAPYPVDWNDIARFKRLATLIQQAAQEEDVAVELGAFWKQADYPHVELKK
jgi:peptidoglycan L-alanyl-D-glutamate endopeptidase CwlK